MAAVAREVWTDERLDDLQKHMDGGFREVKAEIRSLRSEVKAEIQSLRTEVKGEIREVRASIEKLNERFDRLNVTLVASLIGLVLTRYLG